MFCAVRVANVVYDEARTEFKGAPSMIVWPMHSDVLESRELNALPYVLFAALLFGEIGTDSFVARRACILKNDCFLAGRVSVFDVVFRSCGDTEDDDGADEPVYQCMYTSGAFTADGLKEVRS